MHVIGWLPEGVDDRAAFRAAFANGVEVTPLSSYAIKQQKRGALRLGYTGYKPREIWRATSVGDGVTVTESLTTRYLAS